jgi:hypothetical protein
METAERFPALPFLASKESILCILLKVKAVQNKEKKCA